MKLTLMYNPKAGNGRFSLEAVLAELKKYTGHIIVQDTKKKDYKYAFHKSCDLMLIAGGDGTIEKIIRQLKKLGLQIPIAIIPCGNANNIAGSIGINGEIAAIIRSWNEGHYYPLSIGKVTTSKKTHYFVESVGWGLFKKLLEYKDQNGQNGFSDKLKAGKAMAKKVFDSLKSTYFQLFIDGKDYSGKYFWVEIMNCNKIGPSLSLAPKAAPHDPFLDVLLIANNERSDLRNFIDSIHTNSPVTLQHTIKGKSITVGTLFRFHIDDELSKIPKNEGQRVWTNVMLAEGYIKVVNATAGEEE